jgi:hypothetical protein
VAGACAERSARFGSDAWRTGKGDDPDRRLHAPATMMRMAAGAMSAGAPPVNVEGGNTDVTVTWSVGRGARWRRGTLTLNDIRISTAARSRLSIRMRALPNGREAAYESARFVDVSTRKARGRPKLFRADCLGDQNIPREARDVLITSEPNRGPSEAGPQRFGHATL